MATIPNEVVINYPAGKITFDGEELPYYISSDEEVVVEEIKDRFGQTHLVGVRLTILADSAKIVPKESAAKQVVSGSHSPHARATVEHVNTHHNKKENQV